MIQYTTLRLDGFSVDIRLSAFEKAGSGEYHAFIEGCNALLNAEKQYANIDGALTYLAENILPRTATPVMQRYFTSDAVNHAAFLRSAGNGRTAVSVVQQSPLSGAKAVLWAYFVENAQVEASGENAVAMQRSAYRHLFDMQLHDHSKGEYAQTEAIFDRYTEKLRQQGCTLADNAVRTWIFVQGIDIHYADMVKARKLYFAANGMNENTHYIASTGIEGKYMHPDTTVLMDAYAIQGVGERQITYLKGASHLNPTHEYGVTFERATAVDYGDRRHIFVSGTASIDNRGQIVFPLDAIGQTGRTLENIGLLLGEGGATMADAVQMIVYLRDIADYRTVSSYIEARHPDVPKTVVLAPVCRPGWLVEMECMAVCPAENRAYAPF